MWAIDNGLCFSIEAKLRTVIWEFAGEALPDAAARPRRPCGRARARRVAELLDDDEVDGDRAPGRAGSPTRRRSRTTARAAAIPWPLV